MPLGLPHGPRGWSLNVPLSGSFLMLSVCARGDCPLHQNLCNHDTVLNVFSGCRIHRLFLSARHDKHGSDEPRLKDLHAVYCIRRRRRTEQIDKALGRLRLDVPRLLVEKEERGEGIWKLQFHACLGCNETQHRTQGSHPQVGSSRRIQLAGGCCSLAD